MYEYENVPRITYGEGLTFIPVCTLCGRFVKADEKVVVNGFDELVDKPNATCKKCGRTRMIFEGYV